MTTKNDRTKSELMELEPQDIELSNEANLKLPILPIRNAIIFPGAISPFEVGRPKSIKAVKTIESNAYPYLAILAQRKPHINDPRQKDLYAEGCAARLLKTVKRSVGTYSVFLQGIFRIRLIRILQTTPFLLAEFERMDDVVTSDLELASLHAKLKEMAQKAVKLLPDLPKEATSVIDSINDPAQLSDIVASNLDIPLEAKIRILGLLDVKERVNEILSLIEKQVELLSLKEKIQAQIKEDLGKDQREYVLRQQMKAIKEELGEDVDDSNDLDSISEKIREMHLPPDVDEVAKKQLKRLRSMQMGSPEYTVARNYLEWILDLPWSILTMDNMDIGNVRAVLDEDHYGLEKIKRRILEYHAVRKLKENKKGPILCLIGPPGVGKTSLGRSIARALGRKFIRISLGGVHDEAAIRGHRRTYIGALPGKIIQSVKKAGTRNPVFMIDEIDKLGRDFRGDPTAALLEALDPEQNNSFSDHYMEIPFDLSQVMFICTANLIDPIPPALKDRMEILELPGYTHNEKLKIATNHLIPKQLREHGLSEAQLKINDEMISAIIFNYTREAGVRNLERNIASIIRGVAVEVVEGKLQATDYPFTITIEKLAEYLGPQKYISEMADRTSKPGIATSLAWTSFGGEIIFVEAARLNGKGKLTLTGQLGDVMKESARAALSYIKAKWEEFGFKEENIEQFDLHIHIPSGAMPKDGPSAGIAMFAAMTSILTGRKVRSDVAMTGEITLRGKVLPVGGIKEKILAAHRAGINAVLIPELNKPDLVDIPPEIKEDIKFIYVSNMDDVLEQGLEPLPATPEPPAAAPETTA
jgi:ATP-dependent Lon protease